MTRSSGVLLHITSLPGSHGIGDLGPEAYAFVDKLVDAEQSIWQVLPLVPVGYGNSPYASPSTFAGSSLLISPELLVEDRLLPASYLTEVSFENSGNVDFEKVTHSKRKMLELAFKNFDRGSSDIDEQEFDDFCLENTFWLDDFCHFVTLKETFEDKAWTSWPDKYASRDKEALQQFATNNDKRIRMSKFWQFLFHRQWHRLKSYAGQNGIQIFGDLPIYVAHDSADVWANPELFLLDDSGNPTSVAGVPPDYFSETGQRWGNPIYDWALMQRRGFQWWTLRLRAILRMVDIVRLDHFRGFEAFWAVPATETTAVNGQWIKGPGAALFDHFATVFNGVPPIVAEDLGVITKEVVSLMERYRFPGMAILQFGFDEGPSGNFLPHNFERNLVAYTGTHDNDSVVGWYHAANGTQAAEIAETARNYCRDYLGFTSLKATSISESFVRALMASVADLAIVPVQDMLGLDSSSRMNTPGKTDGNWVWRLKDEQLNEDAIEKLRHLTVTFGRARTNTDVDA
ncbi:MAG: 4-alpha-glucanotransferase [Rhodothermales bacterium]|nr:4-alpha-glucanotransferase [Rhodothermales bacterium]